MSTVTTTAAATYKTAGWMRNHLRVSDSLLLRLVAQGHVRVKRTDVHPRYCVEDLQAWLREEDRYAGDDIKISRAK